MNELKLAGLVTTVNGKGTFVTASGQGAIVTSGQGNVDVVEALRDLTAAVNRLTAAIEQQDPSTKR